MAKSIFSKLLSHTKEKQKAIRKAGGAAPKTGLKVTVTTGKKKNKR
jgi:hypothetical protein